MSAWQPDPDTSAIFATMAINGGIGLVLLLIFEKVRYNFEVYAPRLRTMKDAVPAAPKVGFLAWVPQVLEVPDEELLRIAGLDGYVFLRYLRMIVKVGLICSFFGLFVLLPVYGTGAGNPGIAVWSSNDSESSLLITVSIGH